MARRKSPKVIENRGATGRGRKVRIDDPLTVKEMAFVDAYMTDMDAGKAAKQAGFGGSDPTLSGIGSKLLTRPNVLNEIQRRIEIMRRKGIASSEEVMNYLTKVMRGEIKDQFGLDAPLSERTKAAQELAKRTIDLENRAQGKADSVLEIKVDWSRD